MSTAASVMSARIRAMEEDDLTAVVGIETSVYEFPWTRGIFADCLNAGYLCQVYESEAGIFGYGIMSISDGESHILNLCIGPGHQGQGWGSRLLEQLLDMARRYKGRIAFLEVRVSNQQAYTLYHRAGFNEIGMRKAYYPAARGRREDAIVLAKTLT